MRLLLALLATMAAAATANQKMGENVLFDLRETMMETFETDRELNEHEVLKVQLHPMGKKDARPTTETPVWLSVSARDADHSWKLPWRPAGGALMQWLEVLLCQNHPTLRLLAETNATIALPMRWRVSTENVALGNVATMKSSPADVSYRVFHWPDDGTLEVELKVVTIRSEAVCAMLAVTRRCVTHPYELTDEHRLQMTRFSRRAQLTVRRSDAPDGFWLYLIPEVDNTLCPMTASRGRDHLSPPAKTVNVYVEKRAFEVGERQPPLADWGELPFGRAAPVIGAGGEWADPVPAGTCGERVDHLKRQLQLEQQQCGV